MTGLHPLKLCNVFGRKIACEPDVAAIAPLHDANRNGSSDADQPTRRVGELE
ncbi:hypothetical protein AB395_00005386 (plasmid) [Sinorhizobium fredii CCBAU 45436]|nr:hypothetical protein AB395_00005386 [Sinorhizobium fredii CCBAU 45436]